MSTFIYIRTVSLHQISAKKIPVLISNSSFRHFSKSKTPSFGLLIDIDGVIVTGQQVIPKVLETFQKLMSPGGKFRVPTVFVTNSGNQLTREKARQLSELLQVKVPEEHVVCSHDPLKTFQDFHQKNVLVTGQGHIEDVAKSVGFTRTTTIEDLRKVFPMLDSVDITRRVSRPIEQNVEFTPVEAVVLFGEPVRWETFLQLVVDMLLTDGDPRKVPQDYPYPHIPVLVSNMDLQWKFAPQIPRFGHGVFLLCLEIVYKKITGKDLQYRVMVGKPSVVTYNYAQKLIMAQAYKIGIGDKIQNLYMIGDNINTDVFGGNLYNEYLISRKVALLADKNVGANNSVQNCYTVLVRTGVSSEELFERQKDHVHRDFLDYDMRYRQPSYSVEDFSEAIDLIFQLEDYS